MEGVNMALDLAAGNIRHYRSAYYLHNLASVAAALATEPSSFP
jgi:hypothetical protein